MNKQGVVKAIPTQGGELMPKISKVNKVIYSQIDKNKRVLPTILDPLLNAWTCH